MKITSTLKQNQFLVFDVLMIPSDTVISVKLLYTPIIVKSL